MKVLHLETSSKNCSVAISDHKEILCLCEEYADNYKHSESLHTFVLWALEGAAISLKEIDVISLGMGPGSYTGLRIGASAAKGFCFGLQIPLVAVDSLESMVSPFLSLDYDLIIPMVDARRMEVYSAVFDGKTGNRITPTEAKILDENSFSEYQDKSVLFVGDGATKAKDIFLLPNAVYNDTVYPSAQYLVNRTEEKIKEGDFEDIAYFEPFYLKKFQTTAKKNEE